MRRSRKEATATKREQGFYPVSATLGAGEELAPWLLDKGLLPKKPPRAQKTEERAEPEE